MSEPTLEPNVPTWQRAIAPLACLWLAFGGLDLWLWFDGHRPTFIGNGLPPDHYYLLQAAFVGPVMALGCAVWAAVARVVARWLGDAYRPTWSTLFGALSRALAYPVIALYLVPDAIAYGGWGFTALAPTARIAAPLCVVAMYAMSTRTLNSCTSLSIGRAFAAAWCGWCVMVLGLMTVVR